ncbi:unnamed protein product [Phaedon cochleariae]|uniref:Uncharacterized protein n=1 Tax=Phaedon cochleariae TaxID=80249 RepID=A0A9N9SJQ6_PHACE|nr:unnamed protein product [Phaedon cochleariae]
MERIEAFHSGHYLNLDGNDYLYKKKSSRNDATYYECSVEGCSARITERGFIINLSVGHHHTANVIDVGLLKFRQELRRRAASENTPLQEIFQEQQRRYPDVVEFVGSYEKNRNLLYRAQKKGTPPVPSNFTELMHSIQNPTKYGVHHEEVQGKYGKYEELLGSTRKYEEVRGSTRKYEEVRGSTRKYKEMADTSQTGNFFKGAEAALNLIIPEIVKNIMIINGYDNEGIIANIDESRLEEMETFARNELHEILKPEDLPKYYGLHSEKPTLFKFISGHKQTILMLANYSRENFTRRRMSTSKNKSKSNNNSESDSCSSNSQTSEILKNIKHAPKLTEENALIWTTLKKWAKERTSSDLWRAVSDRFDDLVVSSSFNKDGDLTCNIECFCGVKTKIQKLSKTQTTPKRWIYANFHKHILQRHIGSNAPPPKTVKNKLITSFLLPNDARDHTLADASQDEARTQTRINIIQYIAIPSTSWSTSSIGITNKDAVSDEIILRENDRIDRESEILSEKLVSDDKPSANLKNALPSISTLNRYLQNKRIPIEEGVMNFAGLLKFLEDNGLPKIVWISEDGTRITGKIQYDARTNKIVGFVLPLKNGMPQTDTYIATSATTIQNYFETGIKATYAYVVMAQPVVSNSPSFCLSMFGTDNKFTAQEVVDRWEYMKRVAEEYGITIAGFSSDGDTRLLKAMRINSSLPLENGEMFEWEWFRMNPDRTDEVYLQDTVHILTKMRTRFLKPGIVLPMGDHSVTVEHLNQLITTMTKDKHLITHSDLKAEDKMNFLSAQKICSILVINNLKTIPNSVDISIVPSLEEQYQKENKAPTST